jgi:hypothetical protein
VSAPTPTTSWTGCRVFFWGRTACDAALLLNILALLRPVLLGDDWKMVVASWTWAQTRDHFWLPHNEHSMPLGRLSIWLMAQLAGKQTNLPLVFGLQGPLALIAAMVLVYLLVRRESGQAFRGLLAMTLFGVNTHYQNAVNWFSASFGVLALDTLLLGVLAAQRWRQTGRFRHLFLSALWCALAPGWFGSGYLAGPLCALYLLVPRSSETAAWPVKMPDLRARLRDAARRLFLPALVPLLGTAVSLTITLPLNGKQIANLPRVEQPGVVAWQTFKPNIALGYTLRAMVDDVIPGAFGYTEVTFSIPVVIGVWVAFLVLGALWWWRAPHRPLLALGLGLIVLSYETIFTVRAYFEYEGMHHWGRYHLMAHLGLVLFLCGGIPRRVAAWVNAAPGWAIDERAAQLLILLLITQAPRMEAFDGCAQQHADLERVEQVDARCRKHHIDAATAREALPEFEISRMSDELDGRPLSGWDLLRGSPDPRPMTAEEARPLLEKD